MKKEVVTWGTGLGCRGLDCELGQEGIVIWGKGFECERGQSFGKGRGCSARHRLWPGDLLVSSPAVPQADRLQPRAL